MKNLFKNLMLVAVAAMAFTACQNDNNEVNEVAKKTVLDFVATIANQDDTRSGFTGTYTEGEDTYYQSGWDGDETFIVCANGSFGANKTVAIEDAEGHFSVAFEGNVPSSIDVYSPASAWNSENYPTIPAVQTPRANSVDPAAHILKAQAASVESGVVTLQHWVAYGKMTVNTPADFEISKVELSLVGLPNSYWTDNQTYSYTINANEVEGNVFWFATETMQIVKEFTVTAYNAEDQAYSKTVSMEGKEKPLAFNNGQVSTFSVSDLEAVVVPEEPVEPEPSVKTFTSANVAIDWDDEKYIAFNCDNGSLKKLQIDIANAFSFSSEGHILKEGTYSNMSTTSSGKIFTGTWSGSYYGEGEDMLYLTDITITVTHVAEGYHIVFENVTEYYEEYMLIESATYTGPITGLLTPNVSGEGGEGGGGGEVAVPEFVIPDEGVVYDLDWRYTTLKHYLDENNTMTVEKDNGWTWNIRFNSGLSSIEPGDYKATGATFSNASALEVDTYNGAVQYGEGYTFFYPDEFDKVTTFNVQKQGDIYCITMIGSGGYGCPVSGKYRLVYIGKLK